MTNKSMHDRPGRNHLDNDEDHGGVFPTAPNVDDLVDSHLHKMNVNSNRFRNNPVGSDYVEYPYLSSKAR